MSDPKLQTISKGKSIFFEGSGAGEVYLVRSGLVEISQKSANGEKMVLKTVGKNEIFGEMALVDNMPRSATAIALDDTECYVMSRKMFEEKLEKLDPFVRGIFRVLSHTIREANQKLAAQKK